MELSDMTVVHGISAGFTDGDLRIVPNCYYSLTAAVTGRCAATHHWRSTTLGGELGGFCECKASFDASFTPPRVTICSKEYDNVQWVGTPPNVSSIGDVDVVGPAVIPSFWGFTGVIEFADGSKAYNPAKFDGFAVKASNYGKMCIMGSSLAYDCDAASTQDMDAVRGELAAINRMLVMSQTQAEQRVRAKGYSGINQVRAWNSGTNDYDVSSYNAASFHNHGDFKNVVGMGETGAVLNGVQFWTRHNDYSLNIPSRTKSDYHATESVPFPGVPLEVTNKATIAEQITEMQAWFKAFKDQDHSVRDYRPYFRPILSIVEGTWINAETDLHEPFSSDRHHIEAETWDELHSKTRFLYNSGRKNPQENLPFLPTAIREVLTDANGKQVPKFANWEYRIICHPIEEDLPLNRFKIKEDLHQQLAAKTIKSFAEMAKDSLEARFELNTQNSNNWANGKSTKSYIDNIMAQVPGKDNYMGNLTDDASCDQSEDRPVGDWATGEVLNTAFYNRYYSAQANKPENGRRRRAFNDNSIWIAQTSQSKVSGLSFTPREGPKEGETFHQKYSYAFPLEIIYLTPLQTWNPYNLEERASPRDPSAGIRDGKLPATPATALDGIHRKVWYITPKEIYATQADNVGASTGQKPLGVLDPVNRTLIHEVVGGGISIISGDIGGGVGKVRLRYPIMPVHEEGDTTWKELKALKRFMQARGNEADTLTSVTEENFGIQFELTYDSGHHHTLFLPGPNVADLKAGVVSSVPIVSSLQNGHDHTVTIGYDAGTSAFTMISMTAPIEAHLLVKT
jgi:hypothetical protein